MTQLNLTTACNELNWIIKKAKYVCDGSFEGQSWSEFVFWGRINPDMMKKVKGFLNANRFNTFSYVVNEIEIAVEFSYGKDHFHFTQYH